MAPSIVTALLMAEVKHFKSLTPRRDTASLLSLCDLLSPEPRVDIVPKGRKGVASLRTNTTAKGWAKSHAGPTGEERLSSN